jgi:hypothetical protein
MRQAAASLARFFGGIVRPSRPANEKEIEKRKRHREWLEEKQRRHRDRKHHEDREEDYNGVY